MISDRVGMSLVNIVRGFLSHDQHIYTLTYEANMVLGTEVLNRKKLRQGRIIKINGTINENQGYLIKYYSNSEDNWGFVC